MKPEQKKKKLVQLDQSIWGKGGEKRAQSMLWKLSLVYLVFIIMNTFILTFANWIIALINLPPILLAITIIASHNKHQKTKYKLTGQT